MGINDRWFIQIPCTIEEKNAPKYEYLQALYENMRIEAPEKKIFYAIEADTREEAEKILEEVKKTKIKYHWGSILGEKYLKSYHHIYPKQVRLINSKFAFGMELTNCVFDDRYGRNHIFWGDLYIGRDYVEFLNFQKKFKIDILTYTIGWKNIGHRKAIKFSKETISADLEEEFFKKIEKNIQKTSLKFLNIEKGHIKLLKHNNKIYLYIKIFIKKKEKMNMYQSHCRIFIFELDEFLNNGRIIERDLDDDCLRIRSQISHLSIDHHDSIAF